MNDVFSLVVAAFATIIVLAGIAVFRFGKKRRFSERDIRRFLGKMEEVSRKTAAERIVAYDKILDHALASLNYGGTLGEKLKSEPAVLRGKLDEIWRLHKIRNRIVHDLETPGSGIERDADAYERVLRSILRR